MPKTLQSLILCGFQRFSFVTVSDVKMVKITKNYPDFYKISHEISHENFALNPLSGKALRGVEKSKYDTKCFETKKEAGKSASFP